MKYKIKVTPYASEQMRKIVRYISATLQSPENARGWLAQMKREIASLANMPSKIPLTEEEPWHSQGVHKMPVKNFLVYFWVEESAKRVWVTAVVYGGRDQREQLRQMEQ
jgi:toxin ParE1/3/4